MDGKISAPKGARKGGMSDVEKAWTLVSSERQPLGSFSCRFHAD